MLSRRNWAMVQLPTNPMGTLPAENAIAALVRTLPFPTLSRLYHFRPKPLRVRTQCCHDITSPLDETPYSPPTTRTWIIPFFVGWLPVAQRGHRPSPEHPRQGHRNASPWSRTRSPLRTRFTVWRGSPYPHDSQRTAIRGDISALPCAVTISAPYWVCARRGRYDDSPSAYPPAAVIRAQSG